MFNPSSSETIKKIFGFGLSPLSEIRKPKKEFAVLKLESLSNRFIRETTAALRSWLLTNVPPPICLCKPYSCKACLITSRHITLHYTYRIQKTNTPRAGRVGRRTARCWTGRAGRVGRPRVCLHRTRQSLVPFRASNCPEQLFESTNKGNPM